MILGSIPDCLQSGHIETPPLFSGDFDNKGGVLGLFTLIGDPENSMSDWIHRYHGRILGGLDFCQNNIMNDQKSELFFRPNT